MQNVLIHICRMHRIVVAHDQMRARASLPQILFSANPLQFITYNDDNELKRDHLSDNIVFNFII